MITDKFVSIRTVIPDVLDTLDESLFSIGDVLEWASKAMAQMNIYETFEETVVIKQVQNYETFLPCGLLQVNQILYKLSDTFTEEDLCECKAANQVYKDFAAKNFINSNYVGRSWLPLRASTNGFITSVLCSNSPNLITNCQKEYTILPSGKVVTSFKDGWIIISYLRAPMDEHGDFLIPNDEELVQALRFYIMFRMWERRWNMKEEGAKERFEFYHGKWGLYKNMVRGSAKLPSSDQWQNIIEYSTSLLPKKDRYYNYFGTLGVPDTTFF